MFVVCIVIMHLCLLACSMCTVGTQNTMHTVHASPKSCDDVRWPGLKVNLSIHCVSLSGLLWTVKLTAMVLVIGGVVVGTRKFI